MLYLILFVPVLLLCLEGLQDYYIWKSSNYNKYEYTIKWHNVKFFIILFTYTLISVLYFIDIMWAFVYLFYIACLRIGVFNLTYNILRGKKPWYFSNSSNLIDKTLNKHPKLFYFGCVILMIFLNMMIIMK
jgi:hypothetical protein